MHHEHEICINTQFALVMAGVVIGIGICMLVIWILPKFKK
jgi:hypothetical protein